jgi:hypothetical protein
MRGTVNQVGYQALECSGQVRANGVQPVAVGEGYRFEVVGEMCWQG